MVGNCGSMSTGAGPICSAIRGRTTGAGIQAVYGKGAGEVMVNSTKDELAILVTLQRCEEKINRLEADLAKVDTRILALDDQLATYEKQVADQKQRLEDLGAAYRSGESEVKIVESQVEKSQEKLRAVKTNKEYQSTLKEIDDLKKKASALEDTMLVHLDEIEAAESELGRANADLDDVRVDVSSQRKEISVQAEEQKRVLTGIQQEREAIMARMPQALIDKYSKVKHQGRGVAVAAVTDAVCQVCRMNIPPQLFNELQRMDTMRMCPNCQRIIYPSVALEEAIE